MCGLPQHEVLGPQHSGAAGAVIVAALNSPKAKKTGGPFFRLRRMRKKNWGAVLSSRKAKKQNLGRCSVFTVVEEKKLGRCYVFAEDEYISIFGYFFHMVCRCIIVLHYFYDRSVRVHPVCTLLS